MRWKTLATAAIAAVITATPLRAQQKHVFDAGTHSVGHYVGTTNLTELLHSVGVRIGNTTIRYSTKIDFEDNVAGTYVQKHALTIGKDSVNTFPVLLVSNTKEVTYAGVGLRNTDLLSVGGGEGLVDVTADTNEVFGRIGYEHDIGKFHAETLHKITIPYEGKVGVGTEAGISLPLNDHVKAVVISEFDGLHLKDGVYGAGLSVRLR